MIATLLAVGGPLEHHRPLGLAVCWQINICRKPNAISHWDHDVLNDFDPLNHHCVGVGLIVSAFKFLDH